MQIDRFLTGFANCILILALNFFLFACQNDRNPPPDLSEQPLPDFELVRFEQDLFSADTTQLAAAIARLDAENASFSDVFFRFVVPLRRGDFNPEEQIEVLKAFLRYPLIQEIYNRSQQLYGDLSEIGDFNSRGSASSSPWPALAEAFQLYQHYLPNADLPDTITTFVSQFEYAGFLHGEDDLALGLDLFLGPDFDYRSVSAEETIFSDYLSRTYNEDHLIASAIRLLMEEDVMAPRTGRLIDYMIMNGKRIYLLDQVLPSSSDTVIMRMTPQQLDWCQDSEAEIYAYLAGEDLLYSTDAREIRRYVEPAPNSRGMPEAAPGEAANYVGWQIVKSYMKKNPGTSFQELLSIEDGQQLLSRSAYKPLGK